MLNHQLGLIPSVNGQRPLQAMPARRSVSSPCGTNSVTRRSSSRESKGCCNDSRGRSGKWVSPALGKFFFNKRDELALEGGGYSLENERLKAPENRLVGSDVFRNAIISPF